MTIPVNEIPALPRRRFDSHKGTFGKVLIAAGSRGMSGAAVLCSRAALRSGAGLVQVATPTCVQPVVAAGNPCYTTFALHQHADGTLAESAATDVATWAASADALAIGPGLGQGADVKHFVRGVLNGVTRSAMVVDADALNALAPFTDEYRNRASPLVLTPHPGEFARLSGRSADEIRLQREELAVEFAAKFGVVLLLKGANTLVTDGTRLFRNSTGNPGMATGGSGDVLTGTIGALLAQGLSPFDAAVLGAWIHGRAGDLASADLGEIGLTAADIVERLPQAFQERVL
jgi:ADP-dependent NAD(P)H-hydrate dehydratase